MKYIEPSTLEAPIVFKYNYLNDDGTFEGTYIAKLTNTDKDDYSSNFYFSDMLTIEGDAAEVGIEWELNEAEASLRIIEVYSKEDYPEYYI